MPLSIHGTNGITFNDGSTQNTRPAVGFRNRIINGDMRIDQRNAGGSITPTTDSTYTVDRWCARLTQASKFSIAQNAGSVTPPSGFSKYIGATSLSSYSVGTGDYFGIEQRIEGQNIEDLAWGTAGAKSITLSFWVRSSLTGTFGGAFNNGGATARSYPFSYTISSANTWEQKTVSIAGDTSGTWITTNGLGLQIIFGLGVGTTYSGTAGSWSSGNAAIGGYVSVAGATSVVGTNGATFYITGVQFELGSTATDFERRPIGTELALCQRYLPAFNSNGTSAVIAPAYCYLTTAAACQLPFQVQARTAPTGISVSSGSHFSFQAVNSFVASAATFDVATLNCASIIFTISGATTGHGGRIIFNNSSGQILFTGCEL